MIIVYLDFLSSKWLEMMWRVTWQGGVFIGIIFLITNVFRRLSSTVKHFLWMLVIVKFLIMPFIMVSIPLPAGTIGVNEPVIETDVQPHESDIVFEPSIPLSSEEIPQTVEVSRPRVTIHLPLVLFSIWISGVIILLLGIIYRSIKLKRYIFRAKELEDKDILNIAGELAREFRVKPPVLKVSNKFKSPLACGILQPALIFPEDFIKKFSLSELRVIINHELAHIKRLDILTNWFQILTQVIYFFNPLVWFTNRQIRLERETACDDWVLQMGKEERKVYADALLKVVELCSRREGFALGIVGVSEGFALMANRLKMIMDTGRKITTRLSFRVILVLVIVGIISLPTYAGKKSSVPDSVQSEHYKNGWLKHLGNPTGKEGWQKEAAEKAIAEFQKALEIEPDNVIYRHSLAFAFEKLGQNEKAEEEYKKAIELKPHDSFIHYTLARLYAKDKATLDKAIDELRIAVEQSPDEALFHYKLGHILYVKAGEYLKGRQYSITDDKFAKEAFEKIQTGNTKSQFNEYIAPYPEDVTDKMDYIRIINLWSDVSLAEIQNMRDIARANISIGKLYEEQGNIEKAEEVYLSTFIMGKRFAEQNPLALIKMLVGVAIDRNVLDVLEKFYSVKGMQAKLKWVQDSKEKLEEISRLSGEGIKEISKYPTPFWTQEEKEIIEKKEKDFLPLEAPFVREMLKIWPILNIQNGAITHEKQDQLAEVKDATPVIKIHVVDDATNNPVTEFEAMEGIRKKISDGQIFVSWTKLHVKFQGRPDGYYEYRFSASGEEHFLRIIVDGYLPTDTPFIKDGKEPKIFEIRLKRGKVLQGIVTTIDGKTLSGAQVAWFQKEVGMESRVIFLIISEYRLNYGTNVPYSKTDDTGRFVLPPQNGPGLLMVLHEQGWKKTIIDNPGDIVNVSIEPWSIVRGKAFIGTEPAVGQEVSFHVSEPVTENVPNLRLVTRAVVGEDGEFILPRVPAGDISVSLIVRKGEAASATSSISIMTKAGQIHEVQIGGIGRAVIGKVVLPEELKAKQVSPSARMRGYLRRQRPEFGPLSGITYFSVYIDPNGKFRVDDVPSGTYNLEISVLEDIEEQGTTRSNTITKEVFEVIIPPGAEPSDGPFDIGNITLAVNKNL